LSKIFLIFIIIFFTITIIESEGTSNPNLYVSSEYLQNNFNKILNVDFEYPFNESTGCNSFAPKNWDKKSFFSIYFDVMNPSFQISFLRNEFPLVIDNTNFKTSDFVDGIKTVTVDQDKIMKLKLLLFENTGPQNIREIILFPNIQDKNFIEMQNQTYISLVKNIPVTTGSIYDKAIQYDIWEDPYRSFTYPNKLGTYSVHVNDPENLISEVTAQAKRVNYKMEVTYEIVFAKTMDKSSLLITATDFSENTMICFVLDALEVKNMEKIHPNSNEISPSNEIETIPNWMKTNFKWESEGKISQRELDNAIKYLESLEFQTKN